MSSGKSHATTDLIEADRAAHPGKTRRIVVISARIQQAHTSMALYKEFGSKLYSDTVNANFFICQYESQYRFYGSQKWDMVIVDEIRSVLNQGTSTKTNKQNLKMNNDCIRMFMKNAEKTVLLDAHLEYDSMVKDFMEDLYKPSELLVCRYDQNPMKRTIVHTTETWFLCCVRSDVRWRKASESYASLDQKKRCIP